MADFRMGAAYVEVEARGQDRAVADVERAMRAGHGRFNAAGRGAGQAYADGLTRGADGKLRDAAGRFVAAGHAAGRGYGDGLSRGVTAGSVRAAAGLNKLAGGAMKGAAGLGVLSLAAAAAGASIAVLPALAMAAAGPIAVIGLAFKGVGDALKGYSADQDAAGKAGAKGASTAKANARAIRDAASAIDDARRNQAKVARQSAEAIAQASEQVEDAQADERRELERLNEERKEAGRQLDDLREKVSDYALDEADAELAVREARIRLATSNKDVESSAIQRERAALELKQAEERLSDVQRERAQSTAELAEADAKGIDGAKNVVDQQARVASAHEQVDDARANLARTERDAEEARQEAARNSAEAMQNLRDVQDQQAESANVAAASTSKYADAMAKLNPWQRALVTQLIAMKPLVDGLAATASKAFLPGLTQMLRDSVGLFPIVNTYLRDVGTIMGDTARSFGEMFKSEEFKANLDATFKASLPIIQAVSDAMVTFTEHWFALGAESGPAASGFADMIDRIFGALFRLMEQLAPHMEGFGVAFSAIGAIVEALLPVFGGLVGFVADLFTWMGPEVVGGVVVALGGLLIGFKVAEGVKAMTIAAQAMNLVLRANPIGIVITLLGGLVAGLIYAYQHSETFRNIVDAAFRAVAAAARWCWDGLTWVFGKIGEGLDGVGRAFASVADWIGRTWASIREKARAPVQWVVDVVYNNGIRRVWNGVASLFGMSQLGEVRLARGGLVPGVDRGVDYVPALLRGGEGVLVPEAVDMLGGAEGIDHLNRSAERQRFATGGVAGTSTSGGASVTKATGSAQATSTGIGGILSDLMSSPIAAVKRLFSGVMGDGARTPGQGMWRDSIAAIPGKAIDAIAAKAKTVFEALRNATFGGSGASPNGAGGLGPVAAAARQFVMQTFGITNIGGYANRNIAGTGTKSDHALGKAIDVMIPNYRSPAGIALGNSVASYFVGNPARFGTKYVIWRDQINSGGGWKPYGHPGGGRSDTLQHRDHVHVSVFDKGGVANGVGLMPKRTIQPERVLSPAQTEAFERLVDHLTAGGGLQGDRPVVVNIQQTSGSPAETGRMLNLALRSA